MRSPGLPEWIEVNNSAYIISIIDDDGKFAGVFCFRNLLLTLYFSDILVGFIQKRYTATEAEEQVSVCVGPINSNKTRYPYKVALLPDEG